MKSCIMELLYQRPVNTLHYAARYSKNKQAFHRGVPFHRERLDPNIGAQFLTRRLEKKMASSPQKKSARQSTLAFRLINPELFIKPVSTVDLLKFFYAFVLVWIIVEGQKDFSVGKNNSKKLPDSS